MTYFEVALLCFLTGFASAQDANCDFYQNVQAGQPYYISNPNYPRNYTPGVQCRWIANCPSGYNCRLACTEINIPYTAGCTVDRLLISKSGDPQLNAAEKYCGYGAVTTVSTGQRLSVGLITSTATRTGGRFFCELRAQASAPVTPSCRCGYKYSNRIVGGMETTINEYPPMAGVADARISQIKCGAVIIDKRYVLTAAHCVEGLPLSSTAVVLGEHNVNTGDSPATQGIRAASYIRHPQYNPSNYDYDIAIIVLERDIVFSDRVGPVCLPFKFVNTNFTGRAVTALGWGTQEFGGPTSDVLMKVDLNVISQNQCSAQISSLTNRQFCTLTPGKDACQDDSGGPLLFTDPDTRLLFNVGIISYGQACASRQPGINTKVTELLNWITASTPGASYCRK